MVIPHTTVSRSKCKFTVFACQPFLRSVWSDPGAPPGNESNAPPGQMKNGNNLILHTKTEERL